MWKEPESRMSLIRTLVFVLILGVMISPLSAGEMEDLKAAFDQALEYLGQKDLEAFLSFWHPEAVLFSRNRVHPIDRAKLEDGVWAELFKDFFARIISAGYTQQAVEWRVIGDTGLVWGLTRFAVDPRHQAGFEQDTRLTAVFVKVDGEWLILHWNDSPLPDGHAPIVP